MAEAGLGVLVLLGIPMPVILTGGHQLDFMVPGGKNLDFKEVENALG